LRTTERCYIIDTMNAAQKEQLNKAKQALKLVVKDLKIGYKPEKIILFGSLIQNNISENSDIDLMIIKKTNKDPWTRQQEADRYISHGFPIDFLVYTPGEIKERLKSGDPFVKEILKNGKVLHEK